MINPPSQKEELEYSRILRGRIEEQEAQINELKAQVQQLQALNANQVKRQEYLESKLYLVNAATPAQCLAEVKAQAVEEYKKSDEFCKLQDRAYRAGRIAGHNDAYFEQLHQQTKGS